MNYSDNTNPSQAPKGSLIQSAKDLAIWFGLKGDNMEESIDLVVQSHNNTEVDQAQKGLEMIQNKLVSFTTKRDQIKKEIDSIKANLPDSKPTIGHPFLYVVATAAAITIQIYSVQFFQEVNASKLFISALFALATFIVSTNTISSFIDTVLQKTSIRQTLKASFLGIGPIGLIIISPLMLLFSGLLQYYLSENVMEVFLVLLLHLSAISIHFIVNMKQSWFAGEVDSFVSWLASIPKSWAWIRNNWRYHNLTKNIHQIEKQCVEHEQFVIEQTKKTSVALEKYKADIRLNYRLGIQLALLLQVKTTNEQGSNSVQTQKEIVELNTLLNNSIRKPLTETLHV